MELGGWFWSEKFFAHYKKRIIKLFQPHPEVVEMIKEKYALLLTHPKTVGVHVRTFCHDGPDHAFVRLDWGYFRKAIQTFPRDAVFVVCSDDINSCKEHLGSLSKRRKIVFIENNPHYVDFYLLSICKHNIISNSTFSWWAAYLNKNPKKTVICPSIWYKNRHISMKDLFPSGWTVLAWEQYD